MQGIHTNTNLLRKTISMHSFGGLLLIAESCNSLCLQRWLFAVSQQESLSKNTSAAKLAVKPGPEPQGKVHPQAEGLAFES